MVSNNPNFTNTVGMVKESQSVFNGMANTHLYTDAEREGITHPRDETPYQTDIYSQPMAKNILTDIEGALMRPRENNADVRKVEDGD